MKSKILKYIIYSIGLMAFAFFCVAVIFKNYPLGLLSNTSQEALFYSSDDFGYETCLKRPNPSSDKADIFIVGDSFVPHLDDIIERNTNKKVFSMFSHEILKNGKKVETFFNDKNFLKLPKAYHVKHSQQEGKSRRDLVLLLAERTIIDRFLKSKIIHEFSEVDSNRRKLYDLTFDKLVKLHEMSGTGGPMPKARLFIKQKFNQTSLNYRERSERYSFLWSRSLLTFNISQTIKRIQKYFWGDIIKLDIVRSCEWHFAEKTLVNLENSSSRNNKEVKKLVSNFKAIKRKLLKDYNLNLVLMPVPDKISIYGEDCLSEKYDQFIPRLNKALREANIETIGLYDAFVKENRTIYFKDDQHWNKDGVELGVDILLEELTN